MGSCFAYWTGKCLQRHIGWQEHRKSGHHIHMEVESGTDFLLGKVVSFQICAMYNQQFHF